jgi:hypothetical protein
VLSGPGGQAAHGQLRVQCRAVDEHGVIANTGTGAGIFPLVMSSSPRPHQIRFLTASSAGSRRSASPPDQQQRSLGAVMADIIRPRNAHRPRRGGGLQPKAAPVPCPVQELLF